MVKGERTDNWETLAVASQLSPQHDEILNRQMILPK